MSMCDYCRNKGQCGLQVFVIRMVSNGDMYCQAFKPIKMPRISMSWTSPAWVSRNKSVTRRNWMPSTVKRFPEGTKYLAVTSNYGGEALGVGEITKNPYKQGTGLMTWKEYIKEGFEFLDLCYYDTTYTMPLKDVFRRWVYKNDILTVVPFGIIEVFPGMLNKYTTDEEIVRCVNALVRAIG